jgi:opacity protein-like surface antigen
MIILKANNWLLSPLRGWDGLSAASRLQVRPKAGRYVYYSFASWLPINLKIISTYKENTMYKSVAYAALGLACLSSNVTLAEQNYAGGSIAFIDYAEEGISDDASLTMIAGRLGTKFNEHLSGEIRIGLGIGDDSVDVFGTDVDIELDTMFGAYVRGGIQAADSFYPYVVLGYTRGKVTASVPGFSTSESESDVSFGIGADVDINDKLTFNAEYMNYLDKDGVEVDGFSLGIVTKF